MKGQEKEAIEKAISEGYLPKETQELKGTEFHYNFFESMITGRDM